MLFRLKQRILLVQHLCEVFWQALKDYLQEFRYFAGAKMEAVRTSFHERGNLPIQIRKRTHHLERYLWHRDAYPPEFGADAARDLGAMLEKGLHLLPKMQAFWATRILSEYGREGNAKTLCPVLLKGIKRKPNDASTEDLLALMRRRRSRRVWKDTPLTEAQRKLVVEAAQYAPSSCNRQTLSLIFVEELEIKKFVASTTPGGYQFFADAPAIIIFVSDARDYKWPEDRAVPFIDAAAAVENVYLLCETMNLGCCWGSYTSFGSIWNEREVRERLGIPKTHLIVASLAIGESDQHVCEIPRDDAAARYGINRYRG